MSPSIPKGSQVTFDNNCEISDGDKIGFIPNNSDKVLVRKYYKKDALIILISSNYKYPPFIF